MPASTQLAESSLWSIALGGQPIDACSLADALEQEAMRPIGELDFRTQLLVRDSLSALSAFWGQPRLREWLAASAGKKVLIQLLETDLGKPGFPSLTQRIMDTTKTETVLQFFRELGLHCHGPMHLEIGGAIAVILAGMLSRHTEDIDVVDEVPLELRSQHQMLQALASRYGLHLAHFQSHYLPADWRTRVHLLDRFGNLEVLLVDAGDIFLSKLFSPRIKDRDDLRAMVRHLDKALIKDRLRQSASALMAEPRLAQLAADNWYILYAEKLPA